MREQLILYIYLLRKMVGHWKGSQIRGHEFDDCPFVRAPLRILQISAVHSNEKKIEAQFFKIFSRSLQSIQQSKNLAEHQISAAVVMQPTRFHMSYSRWVA